MIRPSIKLKVLAILITSCVLLGPMPGLLAEAKTCRSGDSHCQTFWQRNPYLKSGLIGSGLGAVTGIVLSSRGHRTSGLVKGAALGAGVGLGYQYLRNRGAFERKHRTNNDL